MGISHCNVILHNHSAHIDASSKALGGTLVSSSESFISSEDVDDRDVERHINEKEALAFYRFLYSF